MEIILGTFGFASPGGSETYLLTLAEQLQQLGHEVTVFARDYGPFADFAQSRGVRVARRAVDLPSSCDALLSQDSLLAYELAERFPSTPHLFRAASDLFDFSLPPNLHGVIGAVVVLSDRVGASIRAMADDVEVVRLRQPVDGRRFTPGGPLSSKPRRALLLGNHLRGERLRLLTSALTAERIAWTQVGRPREQALNPEQPIWDADLVFAKARAALEGMACGRAVYVYDQFGADGWVTPESYPALEADNFAGLATDTVLDQATLRADLRRYRPEMGSENRELVVRHHSARAHAQQICELFARLGAAVHPPAAPLRELGRLVRLGLQAEARAWELELTHVKLREQLMTLEVEQNRLLALLQTRRHRLGERLGTMADAVRATTARR